MPRIQDLISHQSLRFADDYDIYVDYGKGKPVKMSNDEETFLDVEKFLLEHADQSKKIQIRKHNKSKSSTRHSSAYELDTYTTQSSSNKPSRPFKFHEYHQEDIASRTNSAFKSHHSSSRPNQSKVIYDESWSSNKHYNPRVTAFIDKINEKFNIGTDTISPESKPSRTCTYQISSGQVIHERIYPGRLEKKLYLRMAVNGASKFMKGQVPVSNLNLINGDFGDDAGIFMENRDFCFVGLADGAGGNRSLGINPADFSRAILASCRKIVYEKQLQSNQLSKIVTSALQQVQSKEIPGSSTICLLALNKQDHVLTSLNIGDSGYIIYRNKKIYCRSTCTLDSDGCGPRQLFALNGSIGIPCSIKESEILEDCSLDRIKVQKNDIIILSSDGLWDVLDAEQLQKIMDKNINNNLQNIVDDLLNQAVDGYPMNNRDDILVIVCQVDES